MTIVHCPKCREEVTVPRDVSRHALVQCPLCREEFRLCDALTQLPPQLIVLQDAAPQDDSPGPPEKLQQGESLAGLTRLPPQTPAIASECEAHNAPLPAFQLDTELPGPSRSSRRAPPGRARRRPVSPVKQLVQIILGGMAGIALSQLILWWIPVEMSVANRDLTGIGRKYGRYVPFLVPAAIRHPRIAAAAHDSEHLSKGRPARSSESAGSPEIRDFPFASAPLQGELSRNPSPHTAERISSAGGPTPPAGSPTSAAASGGAESAAPSGPQGTAVPSPREERADASKAAAASSHDLASPIAEALHATLALDASTSPDIAQRRKLAADFYRSVARLGEAMSLVDRTDRRVIEKTGEIARLLHAISGQADKLDLIETVTPSWMDNPRPHNGIILLGRVVEAKAQGPWSVIRLQLASKDERRVVVISADKGPQDYPLHAQVLVLGSLLADPQKPLPIIPSEAGSIVLAGLHIQLPQGGSS